MHPQAPPDAAPPGAVADADRFEILVVCVGNLCRSPLAERVIRARLAGALGAERAGRFTVASAGTDATDGGAMDPRAAAIATDLGADPDGFETRRLTAEMVASADLVLTATRAERAEAVRLHPAAHRYAFTLPEFARLVGAVRTTDWVEQDPIARARALVEAARARRGEVRPDDPADDDVPDPHGGVEHVHRTVGTTIQAALAGPLAAICADLPPPPATGGKHSARHPARPRRPARIAGLVALGLLLLAGGAVGWLLLRGLQARTELGAARADLTTIRSALLAGEPERARPALADARARAARARRLTGDPIWRLAAHAPYAGGTAAAVTTVTSVLDDLTAHALPALVDAGAALAPDKLRPDGDRVAVAAFRDAAPAVSNAVSAVAAARSRLDALGGGWLPRPVAAAVTDAGTELARAASTLDSVRRATRLVPALLGADGPRRYLLVFQNNAEARGTGGLPGLYAVLSVHNGQITVDRLGSNTDLKDADQLPVDLGPDYTAQWGQDPALWPNSNMDPNFPNAARLWLALWERQTGQRLDGALATDPVAVGYLLAVTGPIRLPSGEQVTGANVVPLTMSQVYARFATGEPQNGFLRTIASSTVAALLANRPAVPAADPGAPGARATDPRALLDALSRAAGERRLVVYSSHPDEERDLATAGLAGTLPDAPGSYAYLVVNNVAGNKMDYYLHRAVRYAGGRCLAGQRDSRITIRLGNGAPAGADLPAYVTQREDTGATLAQSPVPAAAVELVSVYGPRRAGIVRATLDGRPLPVRSLPVDGRPVWSFPLVIEPGAWRTVVLDIREPGSAAAPVVPVQPLVLPQTVYTSLLPCD
jgi:protein-tyrosine-phosphatase